MSNKNEDGLGAFLGCLFLLIAVPLSLLMGIFVSGFVISTLWLWFAVPLGIPAISVLGGAGFSLLVNYISPFVDTTQLAKKDTYDQKTAAIATILSALIFRPAIFLGLGYIITLMM